MVYFLKSNRQRNNKHKQRDIALLRENRLFKQMNILRAKPHTLVAICYQQLQSLALATQTQFELESRSQRNICNVLKNQIAPMFLF